MKYNIVEEFDENGNTIVKYTTEPDYHGNVISQFRDGVTSTFHHDGLGSTIAVTNDAGDVTDTLAYSAFGSVTHRTGATDFPFQFVGQKGYYYDVATSDHLVRRRPYRPAVARWLSPDPKHLAEWNNDFNYVRNSPTNRIDPTGLLSQSSVGTEPASTKCGGYEWTTKWDLDKTTEADGYIIQRVNLHEKIVNCDKMLVSTNHVCQGTLQNNKVTTVTYFEVWKVKGLIVYWDADNSPPKGATGKWDDMFSAIDSNMTYGCHIKYGQAVFIPEADFGKLPEGFKKGNVPNAGELLSICSGNKKNVIAASWQGWWSKYKPMKHTTEKVVEVVWNCCPCIKKLTWPDPDIKVTIGGGLNNTNTFKSQCGL